MDIAVPRKDDQARTNQVKSIPIRTALLVVAALATIVCTRAAACFSLVLLAGRARRVAQLPQVSLKPLAIEGFHSTSYDANGPRLSISADSLTLSHPKLVGPFSLGFMYTVTARNVAVETFHATDSTSSLVTVPRLLAKVHPNVEITEAQLAPLKIIEHRDGQTKVVLAAAACSGGLRSPEIVCRDVSTERNGVSERFRQLTYDGKTKVLHLTE